VVVSVDRVLPAALGFRVDLHARNTGGRTVETVRGQFGLPAAGVGTKGHHHLPQ
jgi:hypothetical protein